MEANLCPADPELVLLISVTILHWVHHFHTSSYGKKDKSE